MNLSAQRRAAAKVLYRAFVDDAEQRRLIRLMTGGACGLTVVVKQVMEPEPFAVVLIGAILAATFTAVSPHLVAAARATGALQSSGVHIGFHNGATAVLTTDVSEPGEVRIRVLAAWPKGAGAGPALLKEAVAEAAASGHVVWGIALPGMAGFYEALGGHVIGRHLIFWRRVEYR